MAVTKLSLYNDTLILLGQRVLSSDSEDRPNRHKLDALYDNGAVDYCLEVIKPRFAAKLTSLTGVTPTLTTAYAKEATLPSTFQTLIGVYADAAMDQPITRFTHEEDKILSDFTTIYVRFIQDFATVGLTNMSFSFGRVVSAYMAVELAETIDPDSKETSEAALASRILISQENDTNTEDPNRGKNTNVDLTTEWFNIYNDTLQLLTLPRLVSLTDDSLRKNQLDIARTSELVEAALEDTGWQFGQESQKLNYNPSIEPAFGPRYAFDKPSDLHRIDGIYADEHHRTPIREYIDEGDFWYCEYQIIYIAMVSNDYLTDPSLWPSYFKRFVAGKLAVDAGPSIPGSDMKNALARFEERESEAKSTDAMKSPPKRFTEGSWAASRSWGGYGTNRNRP